MPDIANGGTLGDFVRLQRGTTYKSKLLGGDGPWLLGLACIARNGGFKSDNLKTYGGSSDPKILVGPGDLLVSLKDVTQAADLLGSVVTVPKSIGQGRLTQDTVKLVFDPGFSAHSYIYWLLRTPQARAHCRQHATGTTNLGLAREDFLALEVPPLDENRKYLLQALQALDDKIDLNRRMNETLEAQARALFRDWFVDFGPVKAKMAGDAPYLAPELWSLFPHRLDEDGVPDGWPVGRVRDVLELAYGKSLPARVRKAGDVPVYGSGGVAGRHNVALVDGPTVIVGRKGTVGSLFWENEPCFPIDTVYYVKPLKSLEFCYQALARFPLETMNTDAAVPGLNRENVYRLELPLPNDELIGAYDSVVRALRAKLVANERESTALTETRDLLLPKLMSGEIRVGDTEKQLEDAL